MDLKATKGGEITDLKINSMLRVRLKIESRMDLASSQLAGFFNLPWLALYLVQDRYEISVCEWEKKNFFSPNQLLPLI